ncbi:MAG: hypothetical protein GF307_10375, partial [candidate division Zixibacteria bacterium]|nr:hypothetical protein [candidate division Zixibacteria bacterium]
MRRLLQICSISVFIMVLISFMNLPAYGSSAHYSGDVWGQWSVDTVFVDDSIRIPPDSTLIIDPGTIVLFWGHDKFVVDNNATLLAVGTETDTIVFDEYFSGNWWHGIRFFNASSSCRLEYCHMTHGWAEGSDEDGWGGAIYSEETDITIANCMISNCYAD